MKLKKLVGAVLLASAPVAAFATNGMNLEGYGPVATAMGGASMAYDNGAAAMMNNPATLGLMAPGSGIGVALGFLGPDVTSSVPAAGMTAASGGDAYYMPAAGYVTKSGNLTYGVGVYSQGGMGAEYGTGSFLSMGTGQDVRSEVGVGRVIVPLAFNVNDKLTIGGSIDWVWATMDVKMVAGAADFTAMTTSMTAGMAATMGALAGFGADRFSLAFSDTNDFNGAATGSGFAGKLGMTYKVSPVLTIGATYHSKTSLGDLETGNGAASFGAYNNTGAALGAAIAGKITVHNFQWPETYGVGMSYQANDKWMIAADYKRINWSGVMKDFKMTYSTANLGTGVTESADFTISQNWDDQDVFMIGASYKYSDALTLRFGGNFANNPVPDNRVHPLFPAIVKEHYTAGLGYMLSKQSGIDFSMTYAPEVSVNGNQATGAAGSGIGGNNGINIKHSQFNWQIQYGYRW